MYVIIVYDVWDKKTNKIHKYLKKRLHWIQNSVFEWEISKSEFIKLKKELWRLLKEFKKENPSIQNSIIIFSMPYKGAIKKDILWEIKNTDTYFI